MDQVAMRNEDALRFARRTRGVDHVSETLAINRGFKIRVNLRFNLVRIALQIFLCDYDLRTRIRQHPGQTFTWIGRIKWQISAAGFENAENRYDRIDGALETYTDQT